MSAPHAIRLVEPRDVPAVVALVREVLAEFGLVYGDGAETDAQLEALPASYADHGGAFWVACDGERVIGTCGVFPVAEATFELRKMYLHPDARGRRVGKRLLEEAIAFARAHGGRRMVLDTAAQMTTAIAFYEANGFVRDDRECRASRCDRGYARDL